ncbi:unnamed protein product [Acanthosepion pharaonis]|uniref:Uncharacterized protein n=1 Tax=Acanthosepion pharaonis TaxID=158019 RepID=A0A812C7Z9_ACAPH|nr:unnamed protein product [Sepia pharaonis]
MSSCRLADINYNSLLFSLAFSPSLFLSLYLSIYLSIYRLLSLSLSIDLSGSISLSAIKVSCDDDWHLDIDEVLLMESRMIFLLICGAFSGFCFVVGCTASVIKAVRDRKRILKKRSERGQVEERDNELIDSQSENLHKSLTKGGSKTTECRRQDFNNTERQRKPGISETYVATSFSVNDIDEETKHSSSEESDSNIGPSTTNDVFIRMKRLNKRAKFSI